MADDSFSEQMQGVTPLPKKRVPRVGAQAGAAEGEQALSLAQQAARVSAQQTLIDSNPLADNFIPEIDPHAILEYAKPGVQYGVLKKLRLGQYEIDARLDLHNHTVEEARVSTYEFVQDCMRYDVRTALLVHGKGVRREIKSSRVETSNGQQAIIKSCVNHWLRELPEVLAFHSAQAWHGGSGAVYVLLRKSDKEKLKARAQMRQ